MFARLSVKTLGVLAVELAPQSPASDHFRLLLEQAGAGQFERIEKGFAVQYSVPLPGAPVKACRPVQTSNRHSRIGTVGVAVTNGCYASGFYVTLAERNRDLDEVGWVVGYVVNLDLLKMLEKRPVLSNYKPLEFISISKAVISKTVEGAEEDLPESPADLGAKEAPIVAATDARQWEREQKLKLELLGDRTAGSIKDAKEIRSVFVARLSPHTRESDLELVFSRFGAVTDCRIVRKQASCFAFVSFERPEMCDEAVRRMNNTTLDDRRIRVDYAHSGHESRPMRKSHQ